MIKGKFILLLAALFSLFLTPACCSTPLYQYHRTSQAVSTYHPIYPIYVDARFTEDQDKDIENVITEWNFALNGSMTLEVISWNFNPSSTLGQETARQIHRSGEGLIMLACHDDDPLFDEEEDNIKGKLAFTNGMGPDANLLVVLIDHMGYRDWRPILLHEFGHALGADHVNAEGNLMFPANSPMQVSCIDKITMLQIATVQHLDKNHLNYCATPDFP
jgi:Matrixin